MINEKRTHFRVTSLFILGLLGCSYSALYGQDTVLIPIPQPVTVQQGDVVFIRLPGDLCNNRDLEIFNDRYQCGSGNRVLVGIHMAQKPGLYELYSNNGNARELVAHVTVEKVDWPRVRARPPKIRTADAVTRATERTEIGRALTHGQAQYPQLLLSAPFLPPLDTLKETGAFGRIRQFSDNWIDQHKGRDDGCAVGTEVFTLGNGVVMTAEEYSSEGKTVIVYHGDGAYSLYLHLSEIFVKRGDHLRGRIRIGLSGDTGNSGGPHLHWAVYVNQKKVDPMRFIDTLNVALRAQTFGRQ